MVSKAIQLLQSAKRSGVQILMNKDQLQVRVSKGVQINEQLLEEIKDNKELLIDFLKDNKLKSKKVNSYEKELININRSPNDNIPLSFSQERLWFIDQLEGSMQYHISAVLRLHGKLNREALIYALQNIVNRHEVLRTVIREKEGQGWQYIMDKDSWQLGNDDYNKNQGEDGELKLRIKKIVSTPFNLSEDCMLRVNLITLGEREHVLVITMHHIASDGWSRSILVKELVELYKAYEEDRPHKLQPLAIQYADYAIWQRRYLQGEVLDDKIDYWKEKLKGVEPLSLPADYVRPSVQSTNGATTGFIIDKQLSKALQMLSQQQGVTLFMTLLTVFKVLLHRYSGQKDICVGTPVAGRQQDEVEWLIGFFVNTLVLRAEVNGNALFIDLLQQVKATTLEAYENQEVSFEKVVEAVVKERDQSRTPLFQAMFVLQNTPEVPQLHLGELTLSREGYENTTSQFDITFTITETSLGLQGSVQYCTDLFSRHTIDRIINSFKQLVKSATEDPYQKIGLLPILSIIEEQQLLVEFNNTKHEYPSGKTIVDLFEEQAAKTPEALAVVLEQEHLTYKELNERSNQVGHYLKSKGIRQEALVPICIERSLEMIVGILGIIKAGGAYVPLDPDYPIERIRYMLEDSGASIVISSKAARLKLQSRDNIDIIELDGDLEEIYKQPLHNLQTGVEPNHLVYVIYTSGSTGKPKGVMNEHKGVVNRLKWAQNYYKVTSEEIILQKTTFSFDVSVWEFLLPLISGAKLVFAKPEGHRDNEYLQYIIDSQKITMLHFVPSMLETFLLDLDSNKCKGLKKVLCSGEALRLAQVELFREKLPDVELHNLYGPTEAAIDVTYWSLSDKKKDNNVIPIGKPVWNTSIYILNETKLLAPIGVLGEIHISGVQVARGYLNRSALTAEKFIDNIYSKERGSRMYRTGDIGRWLGDGNIEYMGRVDEQVKIRGYRIELGEIESVLMQSGLVSQAVVVAREDKEGNKQLTGYVVADEGFEVEAVKVYLKEKLPEYMVPVLWVKLKEFPLTVNGKIDRKGLPDVDTGELLSKEYEAPRNEIEEKLAAIWQELLHVDRVGIHDNFFKIGGHSLLAMRLISAIRRELEVEVVIKDLFIYPTIGELCGYLGGQVKGLVMPSIGLQARPDRIPLSFSQERLWFIDQLEGSVQYHIPSVLRLKGKLNGEALTYALKNIVNRHEVLRTVILQQEGHPYQYVKEKDGWALSVVDGGGYREDGEGLHQLIYGLINEPFDLSKDDMVRAALIKVEEGEHVLVVTFHHIASDGWSTSVLVRELTELYRSYVEGRVAELSILEIQYADYSIWQRRYLQGSLWEKKIGYWKGKLEGVGALQLSTDYPRHAVYSIKGAIAGIQINKEETEQLYILNQQQGTTMFMTLFAVFKVLLFRYSSQEDICVGIPIAGRQQGEVENLIGCFINTLALRDKVEGTASFTELLQNIKITVLEGYENQDVPFEKIVDAVLNQRDLSRPLFQVMFVLQNTPPVPHINLGEVKLIKESNEHTTAQFDVTFIVTETVLGLKISCVYRTSLYKRQTIERMLDHFAELIKSVVKNPDYKVGELLMITSEEKQQLLTQPNNTKTDYPENKSIIDLFEEQVEITPQSIAVSFEQENLTYKELNNRSNKLATYLRLRGVKKETLVPLCIERSLGMMVGIIGILKAGGVYVPIDPEYPKERIRYILEDTGAGLIISNKESKSKLEIATELDIIELDSNWSNINQHPEDNLRITIKPDQLAYVIYTSGSTGEPKGVLVEHGNVVSLVQEVDYVSLNKEDILLSTGSPSFDATTFEYWGMLLNGGQLILCSENKLLDSELLKEEIRSKKVNKMWFTSSWFNKLVELDIAVFEGLKTILVGGEKLSEQHIRKIRQKYADIEIINGYGPTENTTFSLTYKITETEINGSIPIGRPLNNRTAYILDESGQLSPVGVMGEIYVAGSGLSRGYLNRPDLTKEKFILNHFSNKDLRMYRTGDLGRWLPNWNIEYLGRKDDQVKIRGYRIEPGEIENITMQSGLVKQAVVVAKEGKEGSKRLVGYIIGNKNYNKLQLLEYLKSKLPEYMIPASWVEVEEFVLTANGKIDKRALPDADENGQFNHQYVAPENDFEVKLTEIWQELLEVEKVSVHDNFFDIGGDSIIIIQVVNRVRRAGYELQVSDIFSYQTIAQLSVAIGQRLEDLVSLFGEQGYLQGECGLLPIQQWYFEKKQTDVSHFNQSVLLGIDKAIPESTLSKAVEQLIAFHDALRFSYYKKEGKWHQIYGSYKSEIIIEDLGLAQDAPTALLLDLANKYQRSLNIEKGEIIRVVLIKTANSETKNRLLIVIHHLAVDGVSWRILLEDLELLLNESINVQNSNPWEKSTSYRQFYNVLESYGRSVTLLNQNEYWRKIIENYYPLPVDKNYKDEVIVKETASYIVRLGTEQTRRLIQEVPKVYNTEINDILLCSLAITLCNWSKTEKIIIGLEGHGRENVADGIDTSRTIGWFTNLYPILLNVDSGFGIEDLIKSVKDQLRQIPDKGIGFGILKYINKETSLQGKECWEIVFNYLGQVGNVVRENKWISGAPESTGDNISEKHTLHEKLSVTSLIRGGELIVNWRYSKNHYYEQTVKKLADSYFFHLNALIMYCIDSIGKGVLLEKNQRSLLSEDKEKAIFTQAINIKSLFPIHSGGTKMPLYIVCGGGGTILKFKKFAEMFDEDQPIYGLQQSADVKNLEEIPVDVEEIAIRYVAEIIAHNPNGPYALSGHCSGGIVAFEMAKQLDAMGKKVKLLAMFDTVAPVRKKSEPRTFKNLYHLPRFVKGSISKAYLKVDFEMFLLSRHTKHALLYKINTVRFLMRKIYGRKKEVSGFEIYKKLSEVFEIAHLNYKVTPYNGDLLVFYARDHYHFLDKDKNISYKKYDLNDNIKNRWKRYVKNVTIYDIEGEHSTMFEPAYGGKEMARLLQEHLNKCNES